MRTHAFLFLAVVLSRVPLLAQSTDVSQLSPFLNSYCVGCHNQARKVGGLMLDTIRVSDVSMDAEVWEKVLRELRAHTMPLPGVARRPDDAAYAATISTLAAALDQAALRRSTPALPQLSDSELASRLARLLWDGVPDKQLLDAKLQTPTVLEQQIRRMLKDPKADTFVNSFLKKALAVEGFPQHERLNSTLVDSFRRETEMFLAYQLQEDRPVMEMWTANYSFLNEALAKHYGVPEVSGAAFRRVVFPDNTRAGLLGQGSFLTNTALLERTAPSVRGTWMLHNFFGVGTPTPPPNLDPSPQRGPIRKYMDRVYAEPRCSGCHYITRLGYGLENFDQLARWRETDEGEPVDASGTFPDGTRFDGPAAFRSGLLKYRDAFLTTFTERLYAYALGRSTDGKQVTFAELPAVRAILREAAASEYRWVSLILATVRSPAFQHASPVTTDVKAPAQPVDFSGMWKPSNGNPITVTQSATELHVPRGRVWTYHLYKWGDRFEGPGGTKQVQARFDGDKLIVVAAPSVRAGAVLEVWALSPDRNQLTVDFINMSEVTIYFDFKESSISPAYARNRTTYTRVN